MAANTGFSYYVYDAKDPDRPEAINPDLVTKWAQKWADEFAPPGNTRLMNAAQLRRFYGEVKRLELRWQNSENKARTFLEILPMIKLLKAKAAYSNVRKLVPDSFKQWIWDNVDMIREARDFKAFLLYFEAVVGFCYGNGLKD